MSGSLKQIKAVLIDLSGTLHVGNNIIPGAQNAVNKLRKSRLKIKFVTNTTKESHQSLHDRLNRLGFEVKKDEIFTSLSSVRTLIDKMKLRPHLMLSESAKRDFFGVETENPNAVVMGLSPDHFNYEEMNKAMKLLQNGAKLIAINKARYFQRENDIALGTGAFVAALEYATDVKSIVVGKPEKSFFHGAIESLGTVTLFDTPSFSPKNTGLKQMLLETFLVSNFQYLTIEIIRSMIYTRSG
uniref:haloacid dehalogenase-like hydrolase domain-containing protein 2 isoform X3 n=1 Tax=Ciona intestinalis TaxID=7719 RepID=UPI000EF4A266|nr:haloacid dehalogenase-like hydrolase domain-containing protein 2 isoform X3 [Ciona intestinalis]|eukprot:XP_026695462.1 haloacid dehalogenase-like hydrolase domain-containing protein 2 isoform X3 [Ciona intestinalis]